METVFAARGKLYTDRGCVELSANGGLFYRSLYGCYTKDNKQRVARFANHSYVNNEWHASRTILMSIKKNGGTI